MFNSYHEPFLGGAAVYFFLKPTSSYLSDLNPELVNTYEAVKDDVEKVIKELRTYKNTAKNYYRLREHQYRSDYKRAAKFIYLNQTSFNGIYRVNLNGEYNVPFGYRAKNFFDPDNLRLVSEALKNTVFDKGDFDIVRKKLRKNDLVFLDPPYTVTHNNNGFIKYNQKLFSLDDQYRLSRLIDFIKQSGSYYILTNAAHKTIEEVFEKGDRKLYLKRASLIGGVNAKRGHYSEVIFTNIKTTK